MQIPCREYNYKILGFLQGVPNYQFVNQYLATSAVHRHLPTYPIRNPQLRLDQNADQVEQLAAECILEEKPACLAQ